MTYQVINVWINGRFLTRKTTGVERVALGIVKALADHWLDADAALEHDGLKLVFRVAVPRGMCGQVPASVGCIPVVPLGSHDGHLWEQLDLARLPCQDWVLNLCNTGPLLRRRQGIMFHDAQVYAIPANFNWKFRAWYRLLFNFAGRRAAFLLTNSYFSRTELARYTGIESSRFGVAHLGCDHIGLLTPSIPDDVSMRIPSGSFVLAVSSVNPNKNFDAVIQALALLGSGAPNCVIVGQQNTKVFGEASLDSGKVTHLGYVSDETLVALYRRAMCLVFPSFYEGFGLPPIEAMSCGCPVIVSRTSSLPEVCGDAALYCDPHDPQTLADAIVRLRDAPALISEMRERGVRHAQQYTWQATAQQMLNRLLAAVRQSVAAP
jgi:glycosyltransferase involved in cell wall biosynthesis